LRPPRTTVSPRLDAYHGLNLALADDGDFVAADGACSGHVVGGLLQL
jgi:hypothetical protein